MLIHISSQDGFTQSPRTTVNERNKLLFAKVEHLEFVSVENFLNRLQFGEVVATTNGAECRIEFRGFEFLLNEEIADELLPRMFEVELQLCPAIELHIAADQVSLE